MPNSSGRLLEINQLRVRYPKNLDWTLDGLTLQVSQGECLALAGPSGCGKSTLARTLLGLLPSGSKCEGEVCVAGIDFRSITESNLRKVRGQTIGLVYQDPMTRLNPLMTAGEHLLDTLSRHRSETDRSWREQKAQELLDKVKIGTNRFDSYPHEFSGGMRQRLAIALAITLSPSLVIADEPTTSLDVAVANRVMLELKSLCIELGSALLLITHDLAIANRWCEQLAIIANGKVVEKSKTQDLLLAPQSDTAKKLVKAAREREGLFVSKPNASRTVLEVEGLRCWYPQGGWPWAPKWFKAVEVVTFDLHAGECLGVVGASGCGKSTLCRTLMGLEPLRGGRVNLLGKDLFGLKGKALRNARMALQMVFQDPSACLNPKMTIAEAVADPLLIHNLCSVVQAKERARELLEQVGLIPAEEYQNRFPRELSGGQQQRVSIARALALNPKVLICDESISMLDSIIQMDVLKLLGKIQKELGLGVLFITHDLVVSASFCHRIIVLDKGKVVEEGPADLVLKSPRNLVTQKLLASCPRVPLVNG